MGTALGSEPLLSTAWDRPAMLWRLTVDGEPVTGDDGLPLGWARFNDAYDAKLARERAAWTEGRWLR
jgi:hypothetical protein